MSRHASRTSLSRATAESDNEREFRVRNDEKMAFINILNSWHTGQKDDIQSLARLFEQNSRESKALRFLGDRRLLAEKIDAFRQEMAPHGPSFTSLVIAEHYLHDGNSRQRWSCCSEPCMRPKTERTSFCISMPGI